MKKVEDNNWEWADFSVPLPGGKIDGYRLSICPVYNDDGSTKGQLVAITMEQRALSVRFHCEQASHTRQAKIKEAVEKLATATVLEELKKQVLK